jgi:diguanylate cyclase (GGDEF)-like protein
VISIKKYLQPDNETEQILLRVIQVLMQGIALHAVEYDAEAHARFKSSVQQIADSFSDSLPVSEFLVQAGIAVRALDDYNQITTSHFRLRKTEFNGIIRTLTETVRAIATGSTDNVTRLQEIEKQVLSATEIPDVRVLRARLTDCLESIRKEAERQRADAERNIEELIQKIEKARTAAASSVGPGRDPTTGLPMRDAAEASLMERCASGKKGYVALMMVDRIQTYNARFGRKVGDDVLVHFAQFLREALPAKDSLFRWTGPTVVALLDRQIEAEDVRAEVRRIVERIPEFTVRTDSRTAMLPIAARWGVFPLMPAFRLLIQRIEMFTAVHSNTA